MLLHVILSLRAPYTPTRSPKASKPRAESIYLSPTPYTPYPTTPHTPHPTLYTLHPTPYTLHPTPHPVPLSNRARPVSPCVAVPLALACARSHARARTHALKTLECAVWCAVCGSCTVGPPPVHPLARTHARAHTVEMQNICRPSRRSGPAWARADGGGFRSVSCVCVSV